MPNKTIYVKEADLALWETAQKELDESLSGLFAQFLREKVGTPVDGFLYVLHTEASPAEWQGNFAVTFAPIGPAGSGGAVRLKYCGGAMELRRFLREIGVPRAKVAEIEAQLKHEASVHERVALPPSAPDAF